MSQSQTGSNELLLEPPFYLPAVLDSMGIKDTRVSVKAFEDDQLATLLTDALRLSLKDVITEEQ